MPPKESEILQILMESLRGLEGKLDATVRGLADLTMLFHVNKAETVTKGECESKRKTLYDDMDKCKAQFHNEKPKNDSKLWDFLGKLTPMHWIVFGIMMVLATGLITSQITMHDVLGKIGTIPIKAELR